MIYSVTYISNNDYTSLYNETTLFKDFDSALKRVVEYLDNDIFTEDNEEEQEYYDLALSKFTEDKDCTYYYGRGSEEFTLTLQKHDYID